MQNRWLCLEFDYISCRSGKSTAEQKIGTWIDGKTIYRKVIDLGNLPNNTTKTVNTNIVGGLKVISLRGIAIGNYSFPLPFVVENYISMYAGNEASNIIINAIGDRSNFIGYAIIEYTKATETLTEQTE